jgi:hypothetical protein
LIACEYIFKRDNISRGRILWRLQCPQAIPLALLRTQDTDGSCRPRRTVLAQSSYRIAQVSDDFRSIGVAFGDGYRAALWPGTPCVRAVESRTAIYGRHHARKSSLVSILQSTDVSSYRFSWSSCVVSVPSDSNLCRLCELVLGCVRSDSVLATSERESSRISGKIPSSVENRTLKPVLGRGN